MMLELARFLCSWHISSVPNSPEIVNTEKGCEYVGCRASAYKHF